MAHLVLHGDQAKAASYIQYARRLIKRLRASGRKYGSKIQKLENGRVTVKVQFFAQHETIFVFASFGQLYLESGFIDVLNTAPLNEDTYKQAVLHFDDALIAYASSTSDPLLGYASSPFKGKGLVDLQKSRAFGSPVRDAVSANTETASASFTAGSKIYISDAYVDKKKTATRIPAGVFTGKLRLYVQALYGSKRTDFTSDEMGLNLVLSDQVNLPYTGLVSPGIITTDDGYFLCLLGPSSADIYPLKQRGSEASSWYGAFKKQQASLTQRDQDRIEGYLFSETYLDIEGKITAQVTGPETIGSPIAYGWHFDWDGGNADIITHELQGSAYVARHYRVQIIYNHGSFTLVRSQIGANQTWAQYQGRETIWAPDFFLGKTALFMPPDVGGTPTDSAASVYCFYDRNDLKVVDFKGVADQTWTTSFSLGVDTSPWCGPQTPKVRHNELTGASGNMAQSHGFSLGGFDYTGDSFDAPAQRYSRWDLASGRQDDAWSDYTVSSGTNWSACPGIAYPPTPGPYNKQADINYAYDQNLRDDTTVTNSFIATLIIPFADAESVILGKRNTYESGDRKEETITGMTRIAEAIFAHAIDPLAPSGTWQSPTSNIDSISDFFQTLVSWTTADPTATASIGAYGQQDYELKWLGSGGKLGSLEDGVVSDSVTYTPGVDPPGLQDAIFIPSLSNPYLEPAAIAYTSIDSGADVSVRTLHVSSTVFPAHVPVGWV